MTGVSESTLHRSTLESPVGTLTLVASDAGLRAVLWPADRTGRVVFTEPIVDSTTPTLDAARNQLREYFAGTRTSFDVPLDPVGTPFQLKAWEALRQIPFGETSTYGQQAQRMGSPTAVRAVGAANGRNPISIIVPCHRVVGANGSLTGFAGGLDTKRLLLELESRGDRLW